MQLEVISKQRERVDLNQYGSIGLDSAGGIVFDSTVRELRGTMAFRRFREMQDHSSVIGASLYAIESLIRRVPWKIKKGDNGPSDGREVIIQTMLDDMSLSFPDTVGEILSMLVFGFAYMETVFKIRRGPYETDGKYRSKYTDGLIGWRKFVLCPAETLLRWEFDMDGGTRGFWQLGPPDFKERFIPIEKALLFRTKVQKANPQGRSLLLNAYFPWVMSKRIQELEAVGVERDLVGMPAAFVPPELLDSGNTDAGDIAMLSALKSMITSVRRNAQDGIIFPMAFDTNNNPLWEFKLITTGGMRQYDTSKIIERLERRMAMALLTDVLLLGHERVGSLALSKDKTTLIQKSIESILSSIASVINMHAIPSLYRLNGWNVENTCQIVPGDVAGVDLKVLGTYLHNLASVGLITPDPSLENSLREAADQPQADPSYQYGPQEMHPTSVTVAGDQPDPTVDPESEAPKDKNPSNSKPVKKESGVDNEVFEEFVEPNSSMFATMAYREKLAEAGKPGGSFSDVVKKARAKRLKKAA